MTGGAVDEIKAKLEIVPLISEYTQVKKSGASFMAVCPFHHEKTPSLHVSPDKQMWYCHGCGEGGDIFGFIMRVEGLDFLDALRFLARKAGVTLNRDDAKANSDRQLMIEINTLAAKYFHEVLLRSPQAEAARAYVVKRALKSETVEDFMLGFSPNSWDATITFLRKRNYKDDQIIRAGLASKSDKGRGAFDRFRGRLMFPIRDANGNVVGFTARIMPGADGKDAKDEAKYVNTTNTPIYNKSHVLYGLDAARKAIKAQDLAVVVEGNMDVIASHQAGVKNVVASSGTSFTEEQLHILKRFTSRLVLSFDNDPAGELAARRSIDAAVAAGFAVRILRLPPGAGKDPDDCIRKAPTMWVRAITDAIPYMEWYITLVRERTDFANPDAVRDASQGLLKEIAKLTAPAERSHWIRQVADLFQTPESALFEVVQRLVGGKTVVGGAQVQSLRDSPHSSQPLAGLREVDAKRRGTVPKTRDSLISLHILALVFGYPALAEPVVNVVTPEMLSDEFRELYTDFVVAYTGERHGGHEPFNYHDVCLRTGNRELADRVAFLGLLAEKDYGELDSDAQRDVLVRLIGDLKQLHKSRRQHALQQAMTLAEKAGDTQKIRDITAQLSELIV